MRIKLSKNWLLVRLEKDEEVITALLKLANQQQIKNGWLWGIGAITNPEIAFYDLQNKKYLTRQFEGNYEVVSLVGNFAQLKGKPVLHAHIVFADAQGNTFGGHLNRARVAATLEILILKNQPAVQRKPNPKIGLNLLDL